MLGRYDNFPSIIHGVAQLSFKIPIVKLQDALIDSLHRLNGKRKTSALSVSDHPGIHKGELSFEVGIANGICFDYLDEEEVKKATEFLHSKGAYRLLDFMIILRYHYFREGKNIPLKFDYNLLRFIFYKDSVKLHLFHLKGIRRVSLDDFLRQIITNINIEIKRRRLKELQIMHLRTL